MTFPEIYKIELPAIKSANTYYFTTGTGLKYEVRFGRRQENILHAIIVFGVINDEFEGEEYTTTNRGEVYAVMRTISEIVRKFIKEHEKIRTFEFNAIDEPDESGKHTNARMQLYKRYLPTIFDNNWEYDIQINKAFVKKIEK